MQNDISHLVPVSTSFLVMVREVVERCGVSEGFFSVSVCSSLKSWSQRRLL